jgi:hypothetical protein
MNSLETVIMCVIYFMFILGIIPFLRHILPKVKDKNNIKLVIVLLI